MAHYEVLHGRRCVTPHCWQDLKDAVEIGPNLIQETNEKIMMIQARIKATNDRGQAYAK